MATTINGILGTVSGNVGSVNCYQSKSGTIIRSKRQNSTKPLTANQLLIQQAYSAANVFFKNLPEWWNNEALHNRSTRLSAWCRFVQLNFTYFRYPSMSQARNFHFVSANMPVCEYAFSFINNGTWLRMTRITPVNESPLFNGADIVHYIIWSYDLQTFTYGTAGTRATNQSRFPINHIPEAPSHYYFIFVALEGINGAIGEQVMYQWSKP